MRKTNASRREFGLLAGALAARLPLRGANTLTAQDVAQRIQTALGGEWSAAGPDGFKAGDPGTPVKEIATTAMATVDVLERAAKAGANLVITYEPTFFRRQESTGGEAAARDPVYLAKKAFLEKNGLIVFRLRDHWQTRRPDSMIAGLAEQLGWTKGRVQPNDALYDIPAATAGETVAQIRKKLNLRGGLRAVGGPETRVRRVLLCPGVMTAATIWQRYPEADLIVAGEVREWEATHYAADMYTAGQQGGLVTIGRIASEDPGMRVCADWLNTIVKEVPAQWITTGDLYWRGA